MYYFVAKVDRNVIYVRMWLYSYEQTVPPWLGD